MRFIDANVFLHAFLEPPRKLTESEKTLKQSSKDIIRRIEKTERVVTSVIHLSEISNVLESRGSNKITREIIESILFSENIHIAEVNKELYGASLEMAKIYDIDINDCAALAIMKMNNIKEIYSFDSDFDKIEEIKRIEK